MPASISATSRSCRTCWRSSPGTTVDFPEQRPHLPQRVLALEDPSFDLGRYAVGPFEGGPLRSARHRPRVLRHPLAHERVHPGVRHRFFAVTDDDGPLPDRQRAAGHLHRRRLERGDVAASRSGGVTIADGGGEVELSTFEQPMKLLSSLTNRIFLASAAARGAVDRRRDLPRQRRGDARRPSTSCSAASTKPATLVERAPQARCRARSRAMARLIADLPKLKAAVDTNDPPTVQPIADEYQQQLERGPAARDQQRRAGAGAARHAATCRTALAAAATAGHGGGAGHETRRLLAAAGRHDPGGQRCRSAIGSRSPTSSARSASASASTTRSARAVQGS